MIKQLIVLACLATSLHAQVKDTYPRTPTVLTVATLPSSPATNTRATISDGASATDCTTGGGSTVVDCRYTGSAWTVAPSGGGGGGSAPIFGGVVSTGVGQGVTRWSAPGSDTIDATENNRIATSPKAGTLRNLHVRVFSAIPSGNSLVVTVRSDYVTPGTMANTSLTCTVAASTTTCSDTSNSATLSQGTQFNVQFVTSGGTGTIYPQWSMTIE